jgi:hypothetical protein
LSSDSSTTQPQCQYLPQNVVALHTVSHRKLASLSGSVHADICKSLNSP